MYERTCLTQTKHVRRTAFERSTFAGYYPIQAISYLSVLQFSDSAGVGGLERS